MLLSLNKTRSATLELTFASHEGQTFVASQTSSSPLKVWRPFQVGGGRVLVQIVNVSPGVMAGDDYKFELKILSGAKVVLVNQSATKLHSMLEGQCGKQSVSIAVEDDGELEYYPGLTIPFPKTDYTQHIHVSLATSAKFAMLERFSVGRVERGEVHEFRKVSSRVRVERDGKAIYADGLELSAGIGLLDGYTYTASGVWCWNSPTFEPITSDTMILVSGQATNTVAYVRALAKDGLELKTHLDALVNQWRKQQSMEEIVFSRFSS